MTNPTDSPREARIRERFRALLETADLSDPALFGHDLDAFVRDLSFMLSSPGVRPRFQIVSENFPPDAVLALADRAVDEVLAEEKASA